MTPEKNQLNDHSRSNKLSLGILLIGAYVKFIFGGEYATHGNYK